MTPISVRKFTLSVIKPFRWWVVGQIVPVIVWAIHLSLGPYTLKLIIDSLSGLLLSEAYDALLGPGLFYLVIALLFFMANRFSDYVWLHINPFLKRHIGLILMERLMQHAHSLFQDTFSGSLGNKVRDVMSRVPYLLKMVIDRFFGNGLAFLIAAGTVWTVNAKFSMALSLWVVIFIGASLLFSKKAHFL